ncbi:MAG: SLC13 family permease [Planctomycetaceae bacterium]
MASVDSPDFNSNPWHRTIMLALLIGFLAIFAMPTPEGMQPEAHRLIAVTFLMAGLWVTQVVPLAATSLLPLVLFPALGIQSAAETSQAFINDNVFLYLGGFIIALGIERWNLHRRIALNIVSFIGARPRQLVLGFMLATAGLSMWISNTATTLLMLPIALALLRTMEEERAALPAGGTRPEDSALAVPVLLGIAYSASIGGLTTLVGTPTNVVAARIYAEEIPDAVPLSVAEWMLACLPIGIVYLAVTWLVLTWKLPSATQHDETLRSQLRKRKSDLGKISAAESRMLLVFATTAALWILRKPLKLDEVQVLPGWSEILPGWFEWLGMSASLVPASAKDFVNDSTVAVGLAVLLFFIPSGTRSSNGRRVPLMDWATATKLPWDIVLLFGGGFALAGAFSNDVTGLAGWLANALKEPLEGQSAWLVVAVTCLLMTFLTEVTSNVATINTLLASLLAMCGPLGIDPRLLMIPATLATSCAFMLPIATPPNAIIFGSGQVRIGEMARHGLLLNLLGVPVLTAGTFLLVKPLLGIE